MNARHFLGCATAIMLAVTALSAAGSDVADAAMKSDVAAVRALIQKKADVNAPQPDGAVALHWAVHGDNIQIADALIKAGADVNKANRQGVTPLSMAALYGNARMVALLVEAGADVKARGPNGETMLMLAARNGNPEVIDLLVKGGADVNARETVRGTTALMWAAEQRHAAAVKALLAAGADPGLKSGGAGLPRNYMAQRVNTRAVEEAQRRRERAKTAGRTYDEQIEWENQNGLPVGGRGAPGGGQGGQGANPAGNNNNGAGAPAAGAPAAAAPPAQQQPPAPATPQAGAPAAPQAGQAGGRGGGRGRGAGAGGGQQNAQGQGQGGQAAAPDPDDDDTEVVVAGLVGSGGGGLTAMIFAAREGDLESTKALLDAKADINQTTEYGWTPLLTAINNRNYKLAMYLLERGANPNIANKGGWTPLYLATDNRNIEGGDYPVPRPDLDHLEIIQALLDKGADPNATIRENTLTRTIFTMQWFFESGASPFLRAAQSSDTELMKLLLKYKADPKIRTDYGDTALTLAAGIGWVDGVTYERSAKENVEAVRMLLDLGLDPNGSNTEGRTPLMGAALKGRNEVVQMLVDAGGRLETRDRGSRDTHIPGASIAGHTWQALDYAEGLVRVGVQSAVSRPETAQLIRKLMKEKGLPAPPENRTVQSICITDICQGIK
jgi:ankyrin repeat protein